VTNLLNLLDGDSNANGVLDEDEVVALDRRLGQSSLLGVARRIIDAQERGNNIRSTNKGVSRLGKFAMLSGTKTDACQHLLSGGSPLGPKLATYYPVCVRDSEFSPLLQQPSGRCALLPNMSVGSQCFVPGDGVGVSQSHAPATSNTSIISNTSNTSEITPFVPSPQAVCGLLSRLFSKNQGVGGHRSAAGVSSAKWTDPGAELVVGTDQETINIKSRGLKTLDASFRNGFSFFAEVRFHSLTSWQEVFLFRTNEGRWWDHPYFRIRLRKINEIEGGLEFNVRYANPRWSKTLYSQNIVTLGELNKFLFTLSPSGSMEIFRNSVKVGMMDTGVHTMPTTKPFDHLQVAGAGFDGEIRDIRIWDSVVDYSEAISGKPSTGEADTDSDDSSDSTGDLPASCVASRRNSWDFICDETVPPELAEDFGFAKAGDPEAEENFLKREDQGEVTVCGRSTAVKSAVFHGKFGDGLTGEYFRLRTHCHNPFVFGILPTLVKVDETINFQTMKFRAPHNEYVVRWTGKVLLHTGGSYSFRLTSKDGSWLAVSGRLLVSNGGCHSPRAKEGTIVLAKGGHKIGVLFFNRGPSRQVSGQISLEFRGPDSKNQWQIIPQASLGSAPMRLSKLDRHANLSDGSESGSTTVKLGQFIYDEKQHVAVMPRRSCDLECRRGHRKAGGAPFKVFCSQRSDVSFVAMVSRGAKTAFMWLDNQPMVTWSVKSSAALVASNASRAASNASRAGATSEPERERFTSESFSLLEKSNSRAAVLAMLEGQSHQESTEDFVMQPSGSSPTLSVGAGEHTLILQGRPDDDESFALGSIRLEQGADTCKFFLEGKDKMPDDC